MKNMKFLFFIGFISLSLLFLTCEKSDDSDKRISLKIAHLGGCNISDSIALDDTTIEGPDKVTFTIIDNDTLDVFVGINFLCCAGFDATSKINGDTITISISDTCSNGEGCYCHCECYYTWDFMYVDFAKKSYYFKIILYSQTLPAPRIIEEGILDLSDV